MQFFNPLLISNKYPRSKLRGINWNLLLIAVSCGEYHPKDPDGKTIGTCLNRQY